MMSKRALSPTDYDSFAPTYAWARSAVPWVTEPLAEIAGSLPAGAAVLEIGCGTGNYIRTLARMRSDLVCSGFDVSEPMLQEARTRKSNVTFVTGDAEQQFPFPDRCISLAFAVDVIHHIESLGRFFAEACRVLVPGGHLVVVTDSEDTLAQRSLIAFFPEILQVELSRYPGIDELHAEAARAGLVLDSRKGAAGRVPLTPEFVAQLEAKCGSSMRLIAAEQHAAGMVRVRVAAERGEQWLSCYEVLHYVRPPDAPA
jgi:SAM-dependent methyltransferase